MTNFFLRAEVAEYAQQTNAACNGTLAARQVARKMLPVFTWPLRCILHFVLFCFCLWLVVVLSFLVYYTPTEYVKNEKV